MNCKNMRILYFFNLYLVHYGQISINLMILCLLCCFVEILKVIFSAICGILWFDYFTVFEISPFLVLY
ncbi:uncharacterized protein Smp_200930 [Schistosoma mansoni]|uniref:uncharacterized protein n=1 Tax=Schistosoma mansoni TaxID=6183 RepID=UPI00022DC888|nr:uncharacterized protein Smp_200930 [Schistosoma mansoni]|eukprot:XP_018648449.1 uncharacterized protein Smp_200930 [Schistosoma mansoni]